MDARDAIIMANHSLYDSSTECVIWEAFAKRGLGYAAIQGDSNNIEDGLESFLAIERFASMDIVNDRLCWESGVLDYERGGLPFGGTYSGIGVTDNDDGSSYTFDPSIAGIGSHEITYTLAASDCLLSSFAIDTVEVFVDIEAPAITCQENFFVEVPYGQTSYSLPDLFSRAIDNCSSTLVSRQEPPPGTILGLGSNNINFYATDNSGNESSCSSVLIVVELGFEGENEISIYPNPMREGINIDSKKEILDPLQVSIVDINGRLVMSLNFDEFGFNRFILTNQLQNGIYFIKIKSQNINIVDQLIRH